MNRRHFDHVTEELWNDFDTDRATITILLLDVDYFKRYNDHFGHGGGDSCLQKLAKLLKNEVEAQGGVFARYGGEEFIALLRCDGPVDTFANTIVEKVAASRIKHPKSQVADHVTISVGVAHNDQVGAATLDELIAAADSALYEAKRSGRNRAHTVTSNFIETMQREDVLQSTLRTAILERAFEPYYQPQFDASSGRIVGVEVLARWRKKDGSIGGAGELFAAAEKLGVVDQVDAIVQERAINDLYAWTKDGIAPEKFAINVSEPALLNGQIKRLYDAQPPNIQRLMTFELLETIGFDNKSASFNMRLDELAELGAPIEIDDFGTGNTSISTLSFLAPQRLKVARELVMMIDESARGETVLKAIVEIAQSLGIDLIAEGVEYDGQSKKLIALGIEIQQGFYFARPMPADELVIFLKDQAVSSQSA